MNDDQDDTIYTVDTSQCTDKIWLVKMPEYVSKEWNNLTSNSDVGKIILNDDKSYSLICNPEHILNKDVPIEYRFVLQELSGSSNQSTSVKSSSYGSRTGKSIILKSEKVIDKYNKLKKPLLKKKAFVGTVSARFNVMPVESDLYFNFKSNQLKKVNEPAYKIRILEDDFQEFKPKSRIAFNKKKNFEDQNRTIRIEKDKLVDLICSLFEKHQFYLLKDIVDFTKQPVKYVKEIVDEICQRGMDPSKKNMWELKPEYQHYS